MTQPGLVILDGPDAVGKTTLARKLLAGDEDGYCHLEYFPDHELWRAQYFTLIKAALRMMKGRLTVIDRHWPSELIYSRAYRDGTHMNAESRGWDRVVRRLCGVYVICAPAVESAVERHAKSDKAEMYEQSPIIADVAQRYLDLWYGNDQLEPLDYIMQLARNGGLKFRDDAMLYDIDKHGHVLEDVCELIFEQLKFLQGSQYAPALDYSTPNFLGHTSKASVLFVGDEINPNKSGRWPFIDFGASSAALSNVLHDLNFDETRGLWTNSKANHANDDHIPQLLTINPFLQVIALGNKASDRLAEMNVSHYTVIHPSFAKRFNKLPVLRGQLKTLLS